MYLRYCLTKLCDGAQMAIFGDFFAYCIFSEPRAARFRPASSTPCVAVWQTSNLRRLRLGEEKKKTERTRMRANAQRDGRPAEYRWRCVLNAALWLAARVLCSSCAMVPIWRFFCVTFAFCIFSDPRAAHFRHTF